MADRMGEALLAYVRSTGISSHRVVKRGCRRSCLVDQI